MKQYTKIVSPLDEANNVNYVYAAGIVETSNYDWEWQGLVVANNIKAAKSAVVKKKEDMYGKNNKYGALVDAQFLGKIVTKAEPGVYDSTDPDSLDKK